MLNDRRESVKEVLPGYSAEVLGLDGVPTAGDDLNVVEDEKAAKEIAQHRVTKARQAEVGKTSKETLEALRRNRYVIEVPEDVRARAHRAVSRMLAILPKKAA